MRLVIAAMAVANLLVSFAAMAGECDAILQQGLRNTFQELRTGEFKSSFESSYCNKAASSSSTGSGIDAGGSYGGFGLNFGSNNSDTAETRNENCGSSGSDLSDQKFLRAMQSVADKNIVDAWSTCVSSQYGVMIIGELNGDDLLVTYRFRSAGAVSSTVVDGDPYISGAECNDSVKAGTVIDTGGRIQVCTRTGKGPISIAINTSFQPARFFVPAIEEKKAPAPVPPRPAFPDPCKRNDAPIPLSCFGNRYLPGVGVAPEGYTWCILEPQFSPEPGVQGYCFSKETEGRCYCAKTPPGYPQPPTHMHGYVYIPPPPPVGFERK